MRLRESSLHGVKCADSLVLHASKLPPKSKVVYTSYFTAEQMGKMSLSYYLQCQIKLAMSEKRLHNSWKLGFGLSRLSASGSLSFPAEASEAKLAPCHRLQVFLSLAHCPISKPSQQGPVSRPRWR